MKFTQRIHATIEIEADDMTRAYDSAARNANIVVGIHNFSGVPATCSYIDTSVEITETPINEPVPPVTA